MESTRFAIEQHQNAAVVRLFGDLRVDQVPNLYDPMVQALGDERVVIVDVSGRKKTRNHGHLILINPEITEWEGYKVGREGCLSVPDYTGNVIRAEKIHLQALDREGNTLVFDMDGFEARAIQHEMDHLDGLLFLDRLVSRRQDLFQRKVYK